MEEIALGNNRLSIGDRAKVTDGPLAGRVGVVVGIGVTLKPYAGLRRVLYTLEFERPVESGDTYPYELASFMTTNLFPGDTHEKTPEEVQEWAPTTEVLRSLL